MADYIPNTSDNAVATLPLEIEISRGRNDDFVLHHNPMYNSAAAAAVETLWPESTRYSAWLEAESAMTISSSNAADAEAGVGARTVLVEGLNDSWEPISEVVTLNGVTGVTLVNKYRRINSLRVVSVGTGAAASNTGVLYVGTGAITAGKPAVVHGIIEAATTVSRSGIYTVPKGYVLHFTKLNASTHTSAGRVALWYRPAGHPYTIAGEWHVLTTVTLDIRECPTLVAGTDVEFTCRSATTTARDFAGSWQGLLRKV
jgi:hypothetical protein